MDEKQPTNLIQNNEKKEIVDTDSAVDDEEEGMLKPFLISLNDNRGEYYNIANSKGEEIKFYFQKDIARLPTKLNTNDDYPYWCKQLSVSCNRWNLDDVTLGHKLTSSEEDILGTVINDSLGKEFHSYLFDNTSASKKFLNIQATLKSQCTREVKDKMWNKMKIDFMCSSYNELTEKLTNLCVLEEYTQDPLFPITNEFLNSRMKRTLTKDLAISLEINVQGDKALRKMKPQKVIRNIVEVIIKTKRDIGYTQYKNNCSNCGSPLHGERNCPTRTFVQNRSPLPTQGESQELRQEYRH